MIATDGVKSKERSTQEIAATIYNEHYGKMKPPERQHQRSRDNDEH